MQPLQNCIGPTIRIGQKILCLPYAGFLIVPFSKDMSTVGHLGLRAHLIYFQMSR